MANARVNCLDLRAVVDTNMVFRGLDDEDDPGCGGLYLAQMDSTNYLSPRSVYAFRTPLKEAYLFCPSTS